MSDFRLYFYFWINEFKQWSLDICAFLLLISKIMYVCRIKGFDGKKSLNAVLLWNGMFLSFKKCTDAWKKLYWVRIWCMCQSFTSQVNGLLLCHHCGVYGWALSWCRIGTRQLTCARCILFNWTCISFSCWQ